MTYPDSERVDGLADGDPEYDPDLVFDDEPEELEDDEVPEDASDEGVEGD